MYASHRKYLLVLAVLFAVIRVALAVSPLFREDWMLENVLVVAFAVFMVASWRWFPPSRAFPAR